MSDIVNKLWGFCHQMRHDGIDYGDYIEQLTYLLFLKMADEREVDLAKVAWTDDKGKRVVTDCSWRMLAEKSGTGLSDHFAEVLRVLGRQPGLLGEVFTQAVSRFNNPVNLKRVTAPSYTKANSELSLSPLWICSGDFAGDRRVSGRVRACGG